METPDHLNLGTPTGLTISGAGSEIISDTTGAGNAGLIDAAVHGSVTIAAGGQISSSTTSSGTAGTITLGAGSLAMSGATTVISTSSTGSSPASASGKIGTINLTVPGAISLSTGAQIAATTATDQDGGDITLSQLSAGHTPSGNLTLSGSGTAITAASTGPVTLDGMGTPVYPGNSGSISIVTNGVLTLSSHAAITCTSQNSDAGPQPSPSDPNPAPAISISTPAIDHARRRADRYERSH